MSIAWTLLAVMVLWPFGRNNKPAPNVQEQSEMVIGSNGQPEPRVPERLCDKDENGWSFLGNDGMIGVSKVSCQAAYDNWNAAVVRVPVVYNRS